MSAPFILRPVATTLLIVAIVLLGALGYRVLPVAALPSVDFPTIEVTTAYPGAAPDVIATAITAPLEHYFGQISGLTAMSSTSSYGTSQITLQFALTRKIDAAAMDNPLVAGVLVSKDKKSALILADFRSGPVGGRLETTEPVAIYKAINQILLKYQRPGIELRAAGTPIIIGWVNSYGLRYVAAAFAVFIQRFGVEVNLVSLAAQNTITFTSRTASISRASPTGVEVPWGLR